MVSVNQIISTRYNLRLIVSLARLVSVFRNINSLATLFTPSQDYRLIYYLIQSLVYRERESLTGLIPSYYGIR